MSESRVVRRLGQVIELRDECVDEYKRVHADAHPGVRDLLTKHGLTNLCVARVRGASSLRPPRSRA